MRFSKSVVKYRIPILIAALLLMIPSIFGMAATRINYDMLDYLPEDMETVVGQNELLEDFGKGGAFAGADLQRIQYGKRYHDGSVL